MGFADIICSVSRNFDEGQDLIGSESATPSGVATPRPDPVDKRFPGIVHSFFGQVRESNFSQSTVQELPSPNIRGSNMDGTTPIFKKGFDKFYSALPTAPSTPKEPDRSAYEPNLALLVKQQLDCSSQEHSGSQLRVQAYPTPPTSSPSLSTQQTGDDGMVPIVGLVQNPSSCGSDTSPITISHDSAQEREVIWIRGHTAGLNPLSNIIDSNPVRASHLCNPASRSSSFILHTLPTASNSFSAHSALHSHLESTKLTHGVANPSRLKSTPPRTPRALSNDGSESDGRPTIQASPLIGGIDGLENQREAARTSHTKASTSTPQTSPPVGPPKGKLSVRISEARGLKPSYDPYAVCVFEYNEAVARNPKLEDSKTDKDEGHHREFLLGGVPINRSASEIGRSMAIPMKSRQSSTTSLSDQKNFKAGRQVTNPRWDHEALLYDHRNDP